MAFPVIQNIKIRFCDQRTLHPARTVDGLTLWAPQNVGGVAGIDPVVLEYKWLWYAPVPEVFRQHFSLQAWRFRLVIKAQDGWHIQFPLAVPSR